MNIQKLKSIFSGKTKNDETLNKISDYLKAKHNPEENPLGKPRHKPSILGSACLRKIYYSYYRLKKDTKTDAKGARIFEVGLSLEDMILSWLKAVGVHIPYRLPDGSIPINEDTGKPNPQFPIKLDEWRIKKGFIDNIGVSGGELWSFEFKTCASYKFEKLRGPEPEHKVQITPYFIAFNKHLANGDFVHIPELAGHTNLAGVKVIYINKDNSDIKLYSLSAKALNRQAELLEEKLSEVNSFADEKKLPPKTKDKCSYCPYGKACKKDENPF